MIPKPHTIPEAPRRHNDVFTDMYGNPFPRYDAKIETKNGTVSIEGMTYSENQWAVVFRNNETTKVINKHDIVRMELRKHEEEKTSV